MIGENLGMMYECDWRISILIAICYMLARDYNPFIYFRF